MASLNEQSFERKLQNVNNTQDSIQTLSLWCMHHKSNHKKIVQLWMKVLKKSKATQRLNLFYLCNDVIQHSKRKGGIFVDAFGLKLAEAAALVREPSIRPNIQRIFNIWEERNVYDGEFVEKLNAAITASAKVKARPSTKFLAEFKPHSVTDGIEKFTRLEGEVELKRKQLVNSKVDVTSTEALRQLKDRNDGKRFSQQFEEGANKLEEYIKSQEKEIGDRTKLIEVLEKSELFYEAQYSEAKIVANAYKNFGTRVSSLKKRLDELKKFLPDPSSPIPSPTMDAPSPGATPPTPPYDPSQDNVGVEDMDMSDSDEEKPAGTIIAAEPIKTITGVTKSGTRPVSTTTTRKAKVDSTKPIPPPPGLGQVPVTGMMYSPFMSGAQSNTMQSTKLSGSSKHAANVKTSSGKAKVQEIPAYSPGSSLSALSPEGSPLDLQLSPNLTRNTASVSTKRSMASHIITKIEPKKSKYTAPVIPTFGQGGGGLDLDSRLQQVMQNAPILPQSVQKELFDSPARSGQSPNISTPPMHKPPVQPQSWGNSPSSQTGIADAQAGSSSGSMTPSQILGIAQANTQLTGKASVAGNVDGSKGQIGTPLRDEEGTPVRDENTKAPAATANPIEFLSRLISTTQQNQSGASSDFLSGLSALTETVKSAIEKEKHANQRQGKMEDVKKEALNQPTNISTASTTSLTTQIQGVLSSGTRPSGPSPEAIHGANATLPSPPPVNRFTGPTQQMNRAPQPLGILRVPGPRPSGTLGMTVQPPVSSIQQNIPISSPVLTLPPTNIQQGPQRTPLGGNVQTVVTSQTAQPVSPIERNKAGSISQIQPITSPIKVVASEGNIQSVPISSTSLVMQQQQPQPVNTTSGSQENWNNVQQSDTTSLEPTSPIPVLGGDPPKNSIPVLGQENQVVSGLNQIKTVSSTLGSGDTTTSSSVVSPTEVGNPIPSYSLRAGQVGTSAYSGISSQISTLQPEKSLSSELDKSGLPPATTYRGVEVRDYGYGRPIERLDRPYSSMRTIGVVNREREFERTYDREDAARLYGRSYERTRDYDPYRPESSAYGPRGSSTIPQDRRGDGYPPYRQESRYGGRETAYDYDYYYRRDVPGRYGDSERRPYRY